MRDTTLTGGPSTTKTDTPHLVTGEIIDSHAENEKELIAIFLRDAESRKGAALTPGDTDELLAALEHEKELYNATFSKGKIPGDLLHKTGPATRKIIRTQLLRKLQSAGKVVKMNRENILQLANLLHRPGIRVFNPDLHTDPEVASEGLLEYEIFEPPYDFAKTTPPDGRFERDEPYAIRQWGVFGNDIAFSHNHDLGDIPFSQRVNKYAYTYAGIGKRHYKVTQSGRLDITFAVRSLYHQVDFTITDNLGPSNAYLDVENILVVSVSRGSTTTSHLAYIIDETKLSGGDDLSGSLSGVQPGQRFNVNLRTEHSFAQGDNVELQILSYFRVSSYAYLMRSEVTATLSWYLEKIYIKMI